MNSSIDTQRRPTTDPAPWGILAIVLLAGMAGPVNVYKVPPIMPLIMKGFNVSGARAGLLMSIFSVAGLLVALPAGIAFRRMGARFAGLLSLALLVLGSALGSLCTNPTMLLATRFVEGLGVSFMGVVGPAIVSNRFAGRHRAAAMGIWLAYVPLGSAIAFGLVPLVGTRWGWESVWRAGCLYAITAAVLYALFVRPTEGERRGQSDGDGGASAVGDSTLGRLLRHRDLLLVSFLYCSFALVFSSFLAWTPTYLFTVRHQSLSFASTIAGLLPVVGIVGSPLAGWLVGRTGSTKTLLMGPMALFAFTGPLTLLLPTGVLLPFMVIIGLAAAFVPTGVSLVAVNAVRDSRARGVAMSMISMGFNTGSLLGPTVFGYVIEHFGGWGSAFWFFVPLGLAGAAAAFPVRSRTSDGDAP
jgi:predicted MFS family arabinose efflux permease